jgi:hypothetical protein
MAWKQPTPAWAQRRRREAEEDREAEFQEQVSGPLMDLEPEALAAPFAQVEHHAVGRDFLLAGRAVFTVTGKAKRFTFKVQKEEPKEGSPYGPSYFVKVLTGAKPALAAPDDEDDHRSPYSYLGILKADTGDVMLTKGSTYPANHPAVVAIRWTLRQVWAGRELPAPAGIYHEGRCGRCALPLTDPDSILSGFGPECRRKLGIQVPKRKAGA